MYVVSNGYDRFGVIVFSQILVTLGQDEWYSLSRRHFPQEGDQEGLLLDDLLDSSNPSTIAEISSVGIAPGDPTVRYYLPVDSALDQIPNQDYNVEVTYGEYSVNQGVSDNFLAITLERIESYYSLSASFAEDFQDDFESFLASVDIDDETPGNQPYCDPDDNPIYTLEDSLFYGPADTWPKTLANYPYIEFWHRLDEALLDQNIPSMGSEVLGDKEWAELYSTGPLTENNGIFMEIWSLEHRVPPRARDQRALSRPAGTMADVGSIEAQD